MPRLHQVEIHHPPFPQCLRSCLKFCAGVFQECLAWQYRGCHEKDKDIVKDFMTVLDSLPRDYAEKSSKSWSSIKSTVKCSPARISCRACILWGGGKDNSRFWNDFHEFKYWSVALSGVIRNSSMTFRHAKHIFRQHMFT